MCEEESDEGVGVLDEAGEEGAVGVEEGGGGEGR